MTSESFRLSTPLDAERANDGKNLPKKYVVLSVEGVATEVDYFKNLQLALKEAHLDIIVEIGILEHTKNPGHSDPDHVFGRLTDYLEVCRGNHAIPADEFVGFVSRFEVSTLKQYINEPFSLDDSIKTAIEAELLKSEICIAHEKFVKNMEPDYDHFGIVIDRDQGCHTRDSLFEIFQKCQEVGCNFYLSNPCFEFWLLLHLEDVKKNISEQELLRNPKYSENITFVGYEVLKRTKHTKHLSSDVFHKYYLPNICDAVERASQFATSPAEIIDKVGTNLGELLLILECKKLVS